MRADSSWRYSLSTSIGRRHIDAGLGSDDAGTCWTLSANGQEYLIAAVADGAGSAKNAGEGAAIATVTISTLLRQYLIQDGTLKEITDSTIDQWLSEVRQQILNAAELATDAGSKPYTIKDYNTTLLFAVAGDDHTVLCQIGDGAIVVDEPEGRWQLAFEPQRGPLAHPYRRSQTNFVTSDRYEQKREIAYLPRRISKIALFSDGVEHVALKADDLRALPGTYSAKSEAFYEPAPWTLAKMPRSIGSLSTPRHDFFDNAFGVIGDSASGGISEAVSQRFQNFLDSEQVHEVTGDDKCLILACRPD